MKIKVTILRTKETKKITIKDKSKVQDLLKKLDLKPDAIITMSNNKPIPVDDILKDGQEITIMQVSSGG